MTIVRKLGPSLAWSSEPHRLTINGASARRFGWTHSIDNTKTDAQAIPESGQVTPCFFSIAGLKFSRNRPTGYGESHLLHLLNIL
jgi:hypothetical protein